jgi:hypothetical protein
LGRPAYRNRGRCDPISLIREVRAAAGGRGRQTDDVANAFLGRNKAILSRVFDVSLHFEESNLDRETDLGRGEEGRAAKRADLGSDVLSCDGFVVEDGLEGAVEEVDATEAVRDL